MPAAYRLSRSFSTLNLQPDVTSPPRPSTSLGYADRHRPEAVGAFSSSAHAPRRRPRPPLLSLFRKPSFSSWGRSDPSTESPVGSTFSTSSFGSFGLHRRSSSEGGHLSVPAGGRRLSHTPRSPVSSSGLGVDEDPFAALPSPTYSVGQQSELELLADNGWLNDVNLEQVGSFEGELACALHDIVSTPRCRVQAAMDHALSLETSSAGTCALLACLSALNHPPISCVRPLAALFAERWHLQTAPALTPWISVTPPAHIALSGSRFAAAQEELLRSTTEIQASATDPALASQTSDEPSASPLPTSRRYIGSFAMSTPRDATPIEPEDLRAGLTPLLASLLALGEDEGRDLLDPVLLDWASDDDVTEESCFTLASSDSESDREGSRTTATVDSSPLTPATPLSARDRLGKFTRSPGLSPSPGRVEFARATFCNISVGNVVTVQHLASPSASSTASTFDSPTPPLRVNKLKPAKLLLGRPSRSSSLPGKMLPAPPSPFSVGGKENAGISAKCDSPANRPTPPAKRQHSGRVHGQGQ